MSDKRKLTAEQIKTLREERRQGKTYGQLAYRFKIDRMTAWRYVNSRAATLL
jgi:DNA-binding CsgD family transcriptional regulator